MPGLFRDSLGKIVEVYFAGVASREFIYNGKTYAPKKVTVSPQIFRGATCPMGCGGCCFRFSHVYLSTDPMPRNNRLMEEHKTINQVHRLLYVDRQDDTDAHFCKHLIPTTGRCGIHGEHPFSCDFELIRFVGDEKKVTIGTRKFGRGWSYTRVSGQVGALCDLTPPDEKTRDDAARKMRRLMQWTDYFQLETHLPRIIAWIEAGPFDTPLVLRPNSHTLLDRI